MNTMILNDVSFPVAYFSRQTHFDGQALSSNAYINLTAPFDAQAIIALGQETITSLIIKHDNETIYELNDIEARIVSFDENLNENTINANINIQFS